MWRASSQRDPIAGNGPKAEEHKTEPLLVRSWPVNSGLKMANLTTAVVRVCYPGVYQPRPSSRGQRVDRVLLVSRQATCIQSSSTESKDLKSVKESGRPLEGSAQATGERIVKYIGGPSAEFQKAGADASESTKVPEQMKLWVQCIHGPGATVSVMKQGSSKHGSN